MDWTVIGAVVFAVALFLVVEWLCQRWENHKRGLF